VPNQIHLGMSVAAHEVVRLAEGCMHAYTAPWKGKVENLDSEIERNELSWVSFAMKIKDYENIGRRGHDPK